MADQYDLIVIGGGPGGYTAAIRAAQLGIKTACVEKRPNKALGAAKLLKGNRVEVTSADGKKSELEAKNILLATGSESSELPFMKFDGKHIVSSTEALNFNPVPKHLIVVGGGYIGLELGSVWKRLGSRVTVLEFLPRILSISDGEIVNEVYKLLQKQG